MAPKLLPATRTAVAWAAFCYCSCYCYCCRFWSTGCGKGSSIGSGRGSSIGCGRGSNSGCCRCYSNVILTYNSNRIVLNFWCKTAAVLPPEAVHPNNHHPTVICISRILIGKAWAPRGFSEVFITMQPDPVPFRTCVKYNTLVCTFLGILLKPF